MWAPMGCATMGIRTPISMAYEDEEVKNDESKGEEGQADMDDGTKEEQPPATGQTRSSAP